MSKLLYQKGLKVENYVLQLEQLLRSRRVGDFSRSCVQTYGIAAVSDISGDIGNSFYLRQDATDTAKFTVDPGRALLKDLSTGMPVMVDVPIMMSPRREFLTVTGDGHIGASNTWPIGLTGSRYVILRYTTTQRAPVCFKITTGGDTPVLTVVAAGYSNGHNAARLVASGGDVDLDEWFVVGSRILLTTSDAKAASNQGVYTVSKVDAAAATLTLESQYETLAGVAATTDMDTTSDTDPVWVRPAGWFFQGYPASSALKALANMDHWQVELHTTKPAITDDCIYLGIAHWTTGVFDSWQDHRTESLLTFLPAIFRNLQPALPPHVRWQWGIMNHAPASPGHQGVALPNVAEVAFDTVWDTVPSKAWVRVKWGWSGHGHWGTGGDAGVFIVDNLIPPTADSYLSVEEAYAFATDEFVDTDLGGYMYLYAGGVRYRITANTSGTYPGSGLKITPLAGTGMTGGGTVDFYVTPDARKYEYSLIPLAGVSVVMDQAVHGTSTLATSPVKMEAYFPNIDMGIGQRFRVRSSVGDTAAEKSAWAQTSGFPAGNLDQNTWSADLEDIIVIPEAPIMSNCRFDSVDGGVSVSYSRVSGAAAYYCAYTVNGAPPPPPAQAKLYVPDSTVASQVLTLGPNVTLSFFISAQPGQVVRANIWCIDQYGQSSNSVSTGTSGIVAGGVTIGANEKVIHVQNKFSGPKKRTEAESLLAYVRLPRACIITELYVNFGKVYTGAGAKVWIKAYAEGQSQEAVYVSADTPSVSGVVGRAGISCEQVIPAGGWLVVSCYNATDGDNQGVFDCNPDTGVPGTTDPRTDIYIVYRENDVRLATNTNGQMSQNQ